MARRLRPVGLDFVETAPVRLVFAREVSAAPEAVFRALAEDVAGWAEWFSAVRLARPLDGGARREVRLTGGTRFEETVLAAKEAEVYAYRVDVTNAPGMRALVEEWRLVPAGAGTRVQWTFAADGTAPVRLVLKAARAGLGRAFRDAVTSLDRRLAP
ncbi:MULTISPECIES: SRPBCC family protein [unclassified Streptomyces]|uniref:SRPBCC family protein n=1 Tax=unclassified Streptomyces TaxID=2593676 RepID=UPI00225145B8|nr:MULTISPECIES: SRPBCC family protein [unclassified Streptomyces]MCX5053231.1 SRPBCC family protein [Streptomyces sp. NBC_00474]MCX5059500.1 SRPBCC family protein [Streptomyces sp. NBC_00452]MCX5243854.1 SRPBCC family protein [Streptomyces sp. NBC_00201]MCX5290412.1 SRPBCC family protein [Streptomyces sp. NBC_00183]